METEFSGSGHDVVWHQSTTDTTNAATVRSWSAVVFVVWGGYRMLSAIFRGLEGVGYAF